MKIWPITGTLVGLSSSLLIAPLLASLPARAMAVNVSNPQKQTIAKVAMPADRAGLAAINRGYAALKKGWADAAIEAFQQAIKTQPQSVKAHLGLAQAYQKNGAIEGAWTAYQQVVQLDATNQVALRQIGTMGEYRPDWQTAGIAALTQLLKQLPEDMAAQTQRARLLGFQGKFEQAWADYSQLDPAKLSVDTLLKAAETAGFSGRSEVAVGLYDRALQQTPDDLTAQIYRAYFGLQSRQVAPTDAAQVLDRWQSQPRKQITAAVANLAGALPADVRYQLLYNKILAKFPQQLNVHQRSLQVLAQQNPAAAKTSVMQLVKANPDEAFVYFIQGDVAKQIGDQALAAAAYEALIQRQPSNLDGLMALGGVRFEQRRYQAAEQLFNQVLRLDPQHLLVRQVLADLYASQDQPLQALKLLREAEKIQLAQGIQDRQIRDRMAQIQFSNLKRRSFQTPWEGY
ncbi:tetratricopeptide repeat protein [filamentous cyanobacterium LEGE 11480]|uniref:Tetratricopeptide repeat protein n=1 Tax=Romeriopsis navalis LEGE 11480 TaxID=2777977 RepID=A0A928VK27_9CYAN|nr:tetratricopeptide repeat protein [Romeriopsis navalis]MBE9030058.1 tetratricopeptide repeat protein [Romeriopsis navalis LEGE 11480]